MQQNTKLEHGKGTSITRVYKFLDPTGEIYRASRLGKSIEEILRQFTDRLLEIKEVKRNLFLAEGINYIWTAICGGSFTPFNSANAYLGVGDGTTPESYTQTGLQGTNKFYKGMDTGYPTYGSDRKATFRATFGGTEANFTWNEWTVANGNSDAAINMNRKVESLGTKSEGSTWILTVELIIG
jgi:hypothetical protein